MKFFGKKLTLNDGRNLMSYLEETIAYLSFLILPWLIFIYLIFRYIL